MNFSKTWAKAFLNSLDREGLDIEEGIDTFQALAYRLKSLPGAVYGRNAAEKLEKLLRDGIKNEAVSPAFELSIRFLILMVRKNMFRHRHLVINEIIKIQNKKNGVITASLEYAAPSLEKSIGESRITEAIKKRSGAAKLVLEKKQNPRLIGGYRVIVGDEVIDASIRSQLESLKTTLQRGY